MKSFLSFFLVLFLLGGFSVAQDLSVFDIDPSYTEPADTVPPVGFPLMQKWVFDYSANTTLNAGTVGAIFFEGNFYLNRWNAGPCYLIPADANGAPDTSSGYTTIPVPPYSGNIRDLTIAPDNSGTMFLWGSDATSTLRKFDAGMNQIATYATGGDYRAIAWDPVTGGFWNGDFSGAATCYDTTGTLLASSPSGSAVASKYGAAFTTTAQLPGVNSVWWWSQIGVIPNRSGMLTQIDIATDAVIAQYSFSGGDATAGGAEVCQIGNEWILILNFQNIALEGYVIGVIPVELTSFTANASGNNVTLHWVTSSETNNQGYEVHRSSNGNWERVGYVEGNGTTTEEHSYSFTESNLTSGTHYYRLRQIDFDGTYEDYYEISVEVSAPSNYALEQNYPNPFNPSTKISYSLAVDSKVSINVFNVLGEEVATLLDGNIAAGNHTVDFNAAGLNSGVYLYKINAVGIDGQEFSQVRKMMLTK